MVSTNSLPVPTATARDAEVLIMSLLYKNNLFNSFLFHYDRTRWTSPLCTCGTEEQTALHLLTNCPYTDEDLKDQAVYHLSLGNDNKTTDELYGLGTVAVLNCSRDPDLIKICGLVVENRNLNLRRKIAL